MYYVIKKCWYILQTLSGCEMQIVEKIKEKIETTKIKKLFGEIIIPSEKIIEIKHGKKKSSEFKFFPGYILINMYLNEISWSIIKNIPKIIGFVTDSSEKPIAMKKSEINKIIVKLRKLENTSRSKKLFIPGIMVRVKNGPFADFHGIVENIDYTKNRLKVSVSIFGRSTPVELNFNQVEKN